MEERTYSDGQKVVFGDQLYCDTTLKPAYWKRTHVDGQTIVGKVCNTPVEKGESCPNKWMHYDREGK